MANYLDLRAYEAGYVAGSAGGGRKPLWVSGLSAEAEYLLGLSRGHGDRVRGDVNLKEAMYWAGRRLAVGG